MVGRRGGLKMKVGRGGELKGKWEGKVVWGYKERGTSLVVVVVVV